MSTFRLMLDEEASQFSPIESAPTIHPKGHPIMSPDGRALWYKSQGWFWILPEIDGETFYLSLDAEGPVPSWMQYIQDTEGLTYELFPDCYTGEDFAAALLAEGIAPDQPFFVWMSFSSGVDYSQTWTGEGWTEVDWEVLDREKLDPAEVLKRWEAWLEEW